MAINIYRSPASEIRIPETKVADGYLKVEFGEVRVEFATPAGGKRKSGFDVAIEPQSFTLIAHAMMQANPEAALKAFGAALSAGVPEVLRPVWIPSMLNEPKA